MRSKQQDRKGNLSTLCNKLNHGVLICRGDFYILGIKDNNIGNYLTTMRDKEGLDILSVKRGKDVLGWILASEIL